MENLVATLTNTQFLVAVLAAVAAAAVVFSIGATFFSGDSQMRQRIRRVALEREKMRAEEMARLRGGGGSADQQTRTIRQAAGRDYMKNVVERFSLEKAFMDDNTTEKLARAGYRGQGAMTTYLFVRFVTPVALFVIAFAYLSLVIFADKPLWLNAVYALGIGLIGAYLPSVLLKNQTIKRQKSIKRSWPDALDLVLLCVEAAEEGREARMMEAEKKAAALPPMLTVPLIVFFLPVLFIIILSPAMIRVFSNSFINGGG